MARCPNCGGRLRLYYDDLGAVVECASAPQYKPESREGCEWGLHLHYDCTPWRTDLLEALETAHQKLIDDAPTVTKYGTAIGDEEDNAQWWRDNTGEESWWGEDRKARKREMADARDQVQ